MAKKKTADGSAAEGTESAAKGKKKAAGGAKKASAKKADKKPAPRKPARTKKKPEPSAVVVEEAVETAPEIGDVIEAEILGETPIYTIEGDEIEVHTEADLDLDEPVDATQDAGAAPLSEEEQELSAIYGDDLSAPAMANQEFQDQKTRDEDRPMLPEINAREERKQRWEDRRERRKARREERDRGRDQRRQQPVQQPAQQSREGNGHHQPRASHDQRGGDRAAQQQMRFAMPVPAQVNGHDDDGLARVGTPLGDAAAAVFAQLRNGQPLPVRQLAAMMRKRALVNQDPDQLWPQLKAELLGDERSYRTLGLRPRIVYRGRDLFGPGPVAMSVTADAEAGVASALSKLASATHRAFATRLQKASPAGFERLIHAYLVAAGYRDIEWVKRVGGISYATALAPGIERTVLLSARSGGEPIDRRGVGELRVGVEAKDLVTGILFSPSELSEDAERELERAGRSISVVCGDQLVAALINAGVGVVSSAAPMHYLDDQLLEELLAG
jgi:hypothetical protein